MQTMTIYFSSGKLVKPGCVCTAVNTLRPNFDGIVIPRQIYIQGRVDYLSGVAAGDWLITSIQIGRREHLRSGPIPGALFASPSACCIFNALVPGATMEIEAIYMGQHECGAKLDVEVICSVVGKVSADRIESDSGKISSEDD